jgi:AraC-like DNA-binding protein
MSFINKPTFWRQQQVKQYREVSVNGYNFLTLNMAQSNMLPKIVCSCYYQESREGEQFVPDHIFSYQISGTLLMNDGKQVHTFNEGDFRFTKRNQLIKFTQQPPENGEYKNLSILLDQETLRNVSMELGYTAEKKQVAESVYRLRPNPLYKSYMDSILPYLELPEEDNVPFFALKVKEAVLLLLRTHINLKDILFDFTEPGKVDLEEFMQKHFHFNVGLNRFAYLSGRSLATFKRDFEKIFHTSPGVWLQQRRLQEAWHLIREKGKKPSDVYIDVGFEDLSHFSFAFKNAYGQAPSKI